MAPMSPTMAIPRRNTPQAAIPPMMGRESTYAEVLPYVATPIRMKLTSWKQSRGYIFKNQGPLEDIFALATG